MSIWFPYTILSKYGRLCNIMPNCYNWLQLHGRNIIIIFFYSSQRLHKMYNQFFIFRYNSINNSINCIFLSLYKEFSWYVSPLLSIIFDEQQFSQYFVCQKGMAMQICIILHDSFTAQWFTLVTGTNLKHIFTYANNLIPHYWLLMM